MPVQLYRDFTRQEQIDREYDPTLAHDYAPYAKFYRTHSQSARRSNPHARLGVRFGPTVTETLDIFPAAQAGSPVLVFIHGGYWYRPVDSASFSLVARFLPEDGVTVVVTNYARCPHVSVDEITRQSRAALAWLYAHIGDYGGDPARVHICGHSAGGHQVGMLAVTDWAGDYGLPADWLKGGLAISGLFDLRPFRYSWLQPTIQLSHETIDRQSPLFQIPQACPLMPLTLAVGGEESAEFHRQSRAFATAWQTASGQAHSISLPSTNHFSVLEDFVDRESRLYATVLALTGSCRLDSGNGYCM